MYQSKYTFCASSNQREESAAVKELADKLNNNALAGLIFFCSADYDLDKIAAEISHQFSCPVAGCTTAGEIGEKITNDGIIATAFLNDVFHFQVQLIEPLNQFDHTAAKDIAVKLNQGIKFSERLNANAMFGFLLIDGLSVLEEPVTAYLYNAMNGIPIIGGSAGDSLKFTETKVYANGKFVSNAAVFTLIETKLAFKTFRLQHFVPTDKDMVITEADPSTRVVYEIDGAPAAEEYARLVGLEVKELSSQIFAMYPVMLQIGDEWYVRSIQKVNDDGSLSFFCAIDNGLPLTVAKGIGLVETLKEKVDELRQEFIEVDLTLGCDCILRRLETLEKGLKGEVEAQLQKLNFMGFSTFGEQYNSVHVNQTLTGVVLGQK